MGPRFKVSSERLEKPEIEPNTMEASSHISTNDMYIHVHHVARKCPL